MLHFSETEFSYLSGRGWCKWFVAHICDPNIAAKERRWRIIWASLSYNRDGVSEDLVKMPIF